MKGKRFHSVEIYERIEKSVIALYEREKNKERKSIFQILPLIARHSLSVACGFYPFNWLMFSSPCCVFV